MRKLLQLGLILGLSACGIAEKEDFAIDVKRAPSAVVASLGDIRLPDTALAVFDDMKLMSDKSGGDEIVYSIPMESGPGSKEDPATFRFKLVPTADGKSTTMRVFVDVPPIRVLMGEPNMALSEAKVEDELKKVLTDWAKDMSPGSSSSASTGKLSELFAAVAVAGSHKFQSQVNAAEAGFMPFGDRLDESGESTFASAAEGGDEYSEPEDPVDTGVAMEENIESDAEAGAEPSGEFE